jgi:mRNA-degrading endonuclease toxin of MazEF toxin-antitoxin module
LKPFEIYSWQPAGWPEPHPAVVISHPDRAAKKDMVEVLMCSTQPTTRTNKVHEVILDQADGLDWPTLCKCDLIYAVPRGDLKRKRGEVSVSRRAHLLRVMIGAHGWANYM